MKSIFLQHRMNEPTADTKGYQSTEGPKVTIIEQYDEQSCTFAVRDEDHTLGNALRWILLKNKNVLFCGYSITHPSESSFNLRIQTDFETTAMGNFN